MKQIGLWLVCAAWVAVMLPLQMQAQADCGAAALDARVQALIDNYKPASANDAAAVLAAAQVLGDGIAALTADCAGQVSTTDTAAASSTPVSGKWNLTWLQPTKTCAAENLTTTLVNRPVLLRLSADGQTLDFDALFWFGAATFTREANGDYRYLRNSIDAGGSPFSFTYVLSDLTPEAIQGTSTDYYPNSACVSLEAGFRLTPVDTSVICIVGSRTGVNIRSGPGTRFERSGGLAAGQDYDVTGYTTDGDGSRWWKLASGGWVRADLVDAAGWCDDLPEAPA